MKLLVKQQTTAVDQAIAKYDQYLNAQLRSQFKDFGLHDPDDWRMWRQQTKEPFEQLHSLQDTSQRIEKFERSVQLFCGSHYIPRPDDVL
jgi:hypothetical protein